MRYTTIIDIREWPEIYRNEHARLLYLHLVLISGYHDEDRDQVKISIRNLAYSSGLTISATRHALGVLMRAGILARNGDTWQVKKFVLEKMITPRVRSEKKKKEVEARERERMIQAEQEAREREEKQRVIAQKKAGKNPLFEMVRELMSKAANGDQEAAESLSRYKSVVEQIKASEK